MATFNIGGEEGNSFPFDRPGDTVTGTVVDLIEEQSTDMTTGELAFWPNGNPKKHYRLTLATDLRSDDPSDRGHRTVYLKGSRKAESKSSLSAVLMAVKGATGGSDIATGGTVSLTYTGDGEPAQRGLNAPKQYTATYKPPSVNLDGAPEWARPDEPPAPAPATRPQSPYPPAPTHAALPVPATPEVAPAEAAAALAALGITPEQLAALTASTAGR